MPHPPFISSLSLTLATTPSPHSLPPHTPVIRNNGHLVVTDFGLAHIGEKGKTSTNAKSIVGTPLFIAPEILFSQSHDKMVDFWSLVRLLPPSNTHVLERTQHDYLLLRPSF